MVLVLAMKSGPRLPSPNYVPGVVCSWSLLCCSALSLSLWFLCWVCGYGSGCVLRWSFGGLKFRLNLRNVWRGIYFYWCKTPKSFANFKVVVPVVLVVIGNGLSFPVFLSYHLTVQLQLYFILCVAGSDKTVANGHWHRHRLWLMFCYSSRSLEPVFVIKLTLLTIGGYLVYLRCTL